MGDVVVVLGVFAEDGVCYVGEVYGGWSVGGPYDEARLRGHCRGHGLHDDERRGHHRELNHLLLHLDWRKRWVELVSLRRIKGVDIGIMNVFLKLVKDYRGTKV